MVVLALVGALLSSCRSGPPSKLDRLPGDLADRDLKASGIYEDAWVRDTGSIDLRQPAGQQAVLIRGTVPNVGDANFRSTLQLHLDDTPVGHWDIGIGDFAVSAPVPTGAGTRRLRVTFSKSQKLPSGDGRAVGARLSFIGFEPEAAAEGNPSEIIRTSNLRLGSGWGVLETFRNETFRWVDNDAHILLAADHPGSVVLSMTMEPGPGVGSKRFLLMILDAAGRQVSAEPVERRGKVNFIVPATGAADDFRLHLEGGGKPAPHDPRILNFRIFEIEAAPWKQP